MQSKINEFYHRKLYLSSHSSQNLAFFSVFTLGWVTIIVPPLYKESPLMKMTKKKFRIGILATKLNVERFVIRFWEQEFEFNKNRPLGRQRYYDEDDLQLFSHIKELLYSKGFTIAGAKKELSHYLGTTKGGQKNRNRNEMSAPKAELKVSGATNVSEKALFELKTENALLSKQIAVLQGHLKRLQELL